MGRASRRKRGDADVRRRRRNPPQLQGRAETLPTRWNGERCEARRCKVECGEPPFELPDYWGAGVVGEVRRAVEVTVPDERAELEPGRTFYIDDEPFEPDEAMRSIAERYGLDPDKIAKGYHGHGWDKVTKGRGASRYAHRDLYPVRVMEYLTDLGLPIEENAA